MGFSCFPRHWAGLRIRRAYKAYSWRVVDTFCPPEHGKGLNPSIVKGFVPCQGAVSSAKSMDLSLKGVLSLGHTYVIAMLLYFIFGFLCLLSGLLGENFGLLDPFQFLF